MKLVCFLLLLPLMCAAQRQDKAACPADSVQRHGVQGQMKGQMKPAFGPKNPHHFSPREFKKREEAFITEKAKLTPTEATFLFPLFHKMKDMLRDNDKKANHLRFRIKQEPQLGDKECLEILDEIRKLQLNGVQIESDYQKKILKGLSPRKLLLVMTASKQFDREMLRCMFMDLQKKAPGKPNRAAATNK
ncbi:MAG: hypothetical protein ILA34_04715 [Bacteroidaceae bacterium]|nr:hypothetical protein [Bacteroidaceae bacterium]